MEKKKRIRKKLPCPICNKPRSYNATHCKLCAERIKGDAKIAKQSRIIHTCQDCGNEIAKKKYKRCHSCSMKHRWQNEEYKDRCTKSIIDSFNIRWADPESRLILIHNMSKFNGSSKLEKYVASKVEKFGFVQGAIIDKYFVDLINQDKKIIVEVNGDIWHCNPDIFKPEDCHPKKKVTAKEIWGKDASRKEALEQFGYKVYFIWEKEINKGKTKYIESFFERILNETN